MVSRYLEEGERVLAEHRGFYATDRRLLRVVQGPSGEEVHSLPYTRLRHISALIQPHLPLVGGGALLALVGALLPVPTGLAGLVVGVGMGLVAVGFFRRRTYFVFHGEGLSRREQRLWRLEGVREEGSRAVVRVALEKLKGARRASGGS